MSLSRARLGHALLAALQAGSLVYLIYLFFTPGYFNDRRWLLAVAEWVVSALIAGSTLYLAVVLGKTSGREMQPTQPESAADANEVVVTQEK